MKLRITAAVLALVCILSSCRDGNSSADKYRNYYEIFVGAFYDSDGDGIGDLNGVTDRLPYLSGTKNSLGVDGIWLMPVMPSPTYHKYDVTDYMDIDPQYGTLDDFDRLIAECDKLGIAVIIDLVLNHSSAQHPWFQSAIKSLGVPDCGLAECPGLCAKHNPYCGYYNFDSDALPKYAALSNGWYYEAVFWDQMPDLNLDNTDLRDEIVEIARFWLERGVAGFRLDAVTQFYDSNISRNVEFLRWFSEEVRLINPDAYIVAEAWTDAGSIERYYESGIDSFFNFPFSQHDGELVKTLRNETGALFADKTASWDARIHAQNPTAVDAPFLSNHDQGRSAGFLVRDLTRQKMAAALYLFMPGSPFIYYGEEIGMTGSGKDENKRQPMLWSSADDTGRPDPPAGTDQVQSLDAGFIEQLDDGQSLLRFYMEALKLKNKHPEIARGSVTALDTGNPALSATIREYNGKTVYVLHNLSSENVLIDAAILSNAKLRGSLTTDGSGITQNDGTIVMPPFSTAICR